MRLIVYLLSILAITGSGATALLQAENDLHPRAGDGTLRRIRVPILMYHYVDELPEDADDIRTDLTLHPDIFRQHLQYLREEGYTTISLYDLDRALQTGEPLPPKPIILTFDDGHRDHYTNVFPALREFGFTGTFFVITQLADMNHPAYLTWEQIREMATAGMQMESHTKTHSSLEGRDYDYLVYEVMGSIESLEHFTGKQSRVFAYPAGRYDEETLEFLRTTPILRAVTTQFGLFHTTDNYFELPRLRINNETGVAGLAYLLNLDQ